MHSSTVLALLSSALLASAQTTGKLGDAAVIKNNPPGAAYAALISGNALGIRGSFVASTNEGGEGVNFAVSLSGLPTSGGPFSYQLHVAPVASDGNCTSTLAHLDPYERGEDIGCDNKRPESCQVGDLSGKHGKIENTTSYSTSYVDKYASLVPTIGAFFGNRSIVVHFANKTRIACANFTIVDADKLSNVTAIRNATYSTTASSGPAKTSAPAQQTRNAAANVGLSSAAALGAFAALFL